jgi:hypothetical protein
MFRAVLIWLLALALPAQGVMAATMVFCGPNHHERASASAAGHDADPAQQPHEPAAHAHDAATDGHVGMAAADGTDAPDKFAQSALHKCSVCASCCSAAAILDTAPKPHALEAAPADFAALAPVIEPFAVGGPDRPPRRPLA